MASGKTPEAIHTWLIMMIRCKQQLAEEAQEWSQLTEAVARVLSLA